MRRTRLVGAQATLWPDWRHHAFVTDRAGTAIALDADHRRHAVVELAIRDLKQGQGLPLPIRVFGANAAWALVATLAHRKLSTSVRQVDQGFVVPGVSSWGLLIHAAVGSWGGVGGLRTNRSGWAA